LSIVKRWRPTLALYFGAGISWRDFADHGDFVQIVLFGER